MAGYYRGDYKQLDATSTITDDIEVLADDGTYGISGSSTNSGNQIEYINFTYTDFTIGGTVSALGEDIDFDITAYNIHGSTTVTKSKKIINLRHSKILALNSLYFTVMALSLVQSDNTSESFTNLLSASPLIIAPLMFYSVHSRLVINFNFITIYLYISFFCSTVLFFLLLIIHNYFQGYITETYFLHFPERINIGFGKYSIHPLYASISVIISLIFSINDMFSLIVAAFSSS